MGADATSITAEVGGLTLTRHPARSKRARPVTLGRQCIATGSLLEGGQAGVASVISIHCRDANGQRRTQGGDVVTVSLVPEGSAPIDAHITDNTDGTYTCTLLPQRASPHCTLTVMVNGTRIEGSPFKTQILPGGTDASCSEVYGRYVTVTPMSMAVTLPLHYRYITVTPRSMAAGCTTACPAGGASSRSPPRTRTAASRNETEAAVLAPAHLAPTPLGATREGACLWRQAALCTATKPGSRSGCSQRPEPRPEPRPSSGPCGLEAAALGWGCAKVALALAVPL